MSIASDLIVPFPVTIAEVIDHLVLTERGDKETWLLNVGRYNEVDDVEISYVLAKELLDLKETGLKHGSSPSSRT